MNEIHSIIELPTIAKIEASTDVLIIRTNAIKVVRVKERFAVKIGHSIPPLEAENMRFVAANSKFWCQRSMPTLSIQRPRKDTSLWTSSLAQTCKSYYHRLPQPRKKRSARKSNMPSAKREMATPDYFGNLNETPYIDGVLSTPDSNPAISGSFENQEQVNQGILKKLAQTQSPQYIRLLQNMVTCTLKNHRNVFTHGDLQPKNIIVERIGVSDGEADLKVTLIDWNLSGWYPEFSEFCNSTLYCQMKPDWLELIPDIFDQYPIEYLMMQVVYSSVFY